MEKVNFSGGIEGLAPQMPTYANYALERDLKGPSRRPLLGSGLN